MEIGRISRLFPAVKTEIPVILRAGLARVIARKSGTHLEVIQLVHEIELRVVPVGFDQEAILLRQIDYWVPYVLENDYDVVFLSLIN